MLEDCCVHSYPPAGLEDNGPSHTAADGGPSLGVWSPATTLSHPIDRKDLGRSLAPG